MQSVNETSVAFKRHTNVTDDSKRYGILCNLFYRGKYFS